MSTFQKPAVFLSSGKETSKLLWSSYFHLLGTRETGSWSRYALENRTIPRV